MKPYHNTHGVQNFKDHDTIAQDMGSPLEIFLLAAVIFHERKAHGSSGNWYTVQKNLIHVSNDLCYAS